MTRAEAIAQIQRGLGFTDERETEILEELVNQQWILESGQTLPEWLRVEDTLTIAADEGSVAIGSSFIRQEDMLDFALVSSASPTVASARTFLKKAKSFTDLLRLGQEGSPEDEPVTLTGIPTAYFIRNKTLHVRPVPTAETYITGSWYAHDTSPADIAGDETNLWLTHVPILLVGRAGGKIAQDLRDSDAIADFKERATEVNLRMISEDATGPQQNLDLIVGGDL